MKEDTIQQQSHQNSQPLPPNFDERKTIKNHGGKSPNNIKWLSISIVLAALILAIGGVTGVLLYRTNDSMVMSSIDGNVVASSSKTSITNIVDKVSPSVVSIVTNGTSQSIYGATKTAAAGTGIVISKDGYIITNKHVISGAQTINVVTSDGTTYKSVKLVGSDSLNDLAFLKIDNVNNLTAATIGDSSTTKVGQSVIAIGNALGQYQNTVSSGIISGKGRSVSASDESGSSQESLSDMIQTDTAINSGNSGGPLINYAGQVVGINTAVASDAEGIGFSIPINAAKGMIKQVLAGKGVNRAYLGVNYVDITPSIASQYNLSSKYGAYVTTTSSSDTSSVVSGSPAANAGIQDKDIITKVDDIEIGTKGSLSTILGTYQPGETVKLTIIRNGKTMTVNVTLGAYKANS